MGNKPGIMIYFDVAEALKSLSYEDRGRLMEAMLEYGQYGVVPEFEGALSMAWSFMRPKLDRDAERYEETVQQKEYASYCSKVKRKNKDAIIPDYKDWLTERNRTVADGTGCYPTINTTTNISSSTETKGATTADTTAAGATTAEGATTADGAGKGTGEPVHELSFDQKRQKKMDLLLRYE